MRIFRKLIGSEIGHILLSIILGLGLSAVFRKTCNSRNCIILESPPLDDLKKNTYKHNNNCYKFDINQVKCDKNKVKVNIA